MRHNVSNPALQTIINCFKEIGIAINKHVIDQICKYDLFSSNINFKQNFDFVGFKTIILGSNNDNKLCEYYYVSLLDTIPSFLNNASIEQKQHFENYLTDLMQACFIRILFLIVAKSYK